MDSIQALLSYVICGGLLYGLVKTVGGAEELWDAVDLVEVLKKGTSGMRKIENGPMSLLYAIAFALPLATMFGTLAWHFDVQASWLAMAHLREVVAPTLRGAALTASYSFYLLALLTYMPTLLELGAIKWARLNIHALKWLIIGLAVFDLGTDLPVVKAFCEPYQAFFISPHNGWLLNALGGGLYYFVFAVWWFMASFGWEALFVLMVWLVVGLTLKGLHHKAAPVERQQVFSAGSAKRRPAASDVEL